MNVEGLNHFNITAPRGLLERRRRPLRQGA
jgi:hypothetical protein